ncbi:MAG: LamG-like jellyroll fold domain-containing protein [Phycisphaerales bacterium]
MKLPPAGHAPLLPLLAGLALSGAALHAQTATLITHGWQLNSSQFPQWTIDMAQEIAQRAGDARVYRYQPATNDWLLLSTVGPASDANVVLVADWLAECSGSDSPQRGYAEGAADALFSAMLDPRAGLAGVTLADKSIHLIGHSRGAVVNSELARRFVANGIGVDQLTYLDPHPVNGTFAEPIALDWGDPVPRVWEGVTWADNYYRTDSDIFDFNGMPVPGTHAPSLSDAMFPGANTYAHLDVHLWYHGTIRPTTPQVCDSSFCVTAANMPTWYPAGRNSEGYRFSALAAGQAQRDAAGTAPRVATAFPAVIYNGAFDSGSMAGWGYHGGGGGATAVTQGSGYALRLDPGAERTHNDFVAPLVPSVVQFQAARAGGTGTGNTLVVSIASPGVTTHTFAPVDVSTLPASLAMRPFLPIPEQFRGHACTLRFQHVPGGGAGYVLLDNIAATTCSADTVALWAFDQSGAETCGRSTLDGTLAGAASIANAGPRPWSISGYAATLPGAPSRINIPAQLASLPLPAGTLEAWVMVEGSDPASAGGVVFNYGTAGTRTDLQASILPPAAPGGPLRSMLWADTGGAAPVDMPGLTMHAWHHTAWTWNGAQHEYYVDGRRVAVVASTMTPAFAGNEAEIGSDDDETGYFVGRIADVRLSARVLLGPELANGAFPGGCDPTDFNHDGLFPDTADIDDFLSVFSGGPCSTGTCGDIDFNNDGLFPDTADIDALLSVFSGGPCT